MRDEIGTSNDKRAFRVVHGETPMNGAEGKWKTTRLQSYQYLFYSRWVLASGHSTNHARNQLDIITTTRVIKLFYYDKVVIPLKCYKSYTESVFAEIRVEVV